jgi:hypothetical protein
MCRASGRGGGHLLPDGAATPRRVATRRSGAGQRATDVKGLARCRRTTNSRSSRMRGNRGDRSRRESSGRTTSRNVSQIGQYEIVSLIVACSASISPSLQITVCCRAGRRRSRVTLSDYPFGSNIELSRGIFSTVASRGPAAAACSVGPRVRTIARLLGRTLHRSQMDVLEPPRDQQIQVPQDDLMSWSRRRRHVVLSVDQLVTLPVVWEVHEVVVGELQSRVGRLSRDRSRASAHSKRARRFACQCVLRDNFEECCSQSLRVRVCREHVGP